MMRIPTALPVVLLAALAAMLPASRPSPDSSPEPVRRPGPRAIQAWQDRKLGMFIHWGIFSIPGGVWKGRRITDGYSEQIQSHAPIPKEEHEPLAKQFNPVKWDPDAVVSLAKAADMKFIVITSKHHDGFNMFHTKPESPRRVQRRPVEGADVRVVNRESAESLCEG